MTIEARAPREDPGRSWHPRYTSGDLPDLTDEDMKAHLAKPEYADERDAGPLAAEDSAETPEDVV